MKSQVSQGDDKVNIKIQCKQQKAISNQTHTVRGFFQEEYRNEKKEKLYHFYNQVHVELKKHLKS
jgi:hypothetical protein